jgi:HSP20 family protein
VIEKRPTMFMSCPRLRRGPQHLPDEAPDKGSYHRRERRYGQFSRSVQLPEELDAEKASAECENGLLTVRIPKNPAAKPRKISVQRA